MNKLKDAYERYLHCDALYNTRYESYFPPEIIKWGMEEIERLRKILEIIAMDVTEYEDWEHELKSCIRIAKKALGRTE